MEVNVTFRNAEQEQFFWHQERNGLFDGGFGNGKTYVAMQKAITHLLIFNSYRISIARQKYKVLRATTMSTFFKILPPKFIYRHDEQLGLTVLLNKSLIYWMHLDTSDEQDLRGLEINSAVIDQAEETKENLYLVLDARIGRWDKAIVPDWLLESKVIDSDFLTYIKKVKPSDSRRKELEAKTTWPRHPKWGHFLVPNYMDCLCNPSEEDEFHWTYRRYNPESEEREAEHFYIHRETDKELYDEGTYKQMLKRDPEWVDKYVKGLTGTPKAIIHKIRPESIIHPEDVINERGQEFWENFLEKIKTKAALFRILDHGETGVSTCGWAAALNGVHIFFREYYIAATLISENRKNIYELSFDEEYVGNFADPQIFKKTTQKVNKQESGFWTVALEYQDISEIDKELSPPIYWSPADNNEFATRNRINELLKPQERFIHPITGTKNSPGIYFIKAVTETYPYGCREIINQLKHQKRKLLGTDNGRNIYSEERDGSIIDHGYDLVRYYVSMHNKGMKLPKRSPPRHSFEYYNRLLKQRKAIREASRI